MVLPVTLQRPLFDPRYGFVAGMSPSRVMRDFAERHMAVARGIVRTLRRYRPRFAPSPTLM
ncbi:MAG: hypothetical protein WKH64_11495 [Chloroflexia bacterium]